MLVAEILKRKQEAVTCFKCSQQFVPFCRDPPFEFCSHCNAKNVLEEAGPLLKWVRMTSCDHVFKAKIDEAAQVCGVCNRPVSDKNQIHELQVSKPRKIDKETPLRDRIRNEYRAAPWLILPERYEAKCIWKKCQKKFIPYTADALNCLKCSHCDKLCPTATIIGKKWLYFDCSHLSSVPEKEDRKKCPQCDADVHQRYVDLHTGSLNRRRRDSERLLFENECYESVPMEARLSESRQSQYRFYKKSTKMAPQVMFLLDKTKPKYFTCGAAVHCKIALFVIILLTVIGEIIELCAYIFGGRIPTGYEMLFEVIEYYVTISLVLGFWKESGLMLIPFIGQTLLVVILLLLNTIFIFYCCFFPFSTIAENFLYKRSYSFWEREQKFLLALAFMALFTTFAGWCLQVALTSYQYFEDRNAERKTRESRAPVDQNGSRPPLVQPSFVNPNFSIEDDDDKVFDSKQRNAAELV